MPLLVSGDGIDIMQTVCRQAQEWFGGAIDVTLSVFSDEEELVILKNGVFAGHCKIPRRESLSAHAMYSSQAMVVLATAKVCFHRSSQIYTDVYRTGAFVVILKLSTTE